MEKSSFGDLDGTLDAEPEELQKINVMAQQSQTRPSADDAPPMEFEATVDADDEVVDELRTGSLPTQDQAAQTMRQSIQTVAQQPVMPDAGVTMDVDDEEMGDIWQVASKSGVSMNQTIGGSVNDSALPAMHAGVQQKRTEADPDADPIGAAPPEYQIQRVLGEGGIGVVMEAKQSSLDRLIAIKMLHGHLTTEKRQRKFLSEALVIGELEHPNIIPIHDLGVNADGQVFYAMKRVEGTPWDECIKTMPTPKNIEVLLKVCDAIAFAHDKGVLHRDLKPANIMLGTYNEVLVMDWGMAASVTGKNKAARLMPNNAAGGTPTYMAPEMAAGDFKRIGYHSDVYLLGAILYEIVTGKRAHTGTSVKDCLENAKKNIIQPTEETGELIEIAMKAMATSVKERYSTVQEFHKALEAYQSHQESYELCKTARRSLRRAGKSQEYDDYAQALYSFRNAQNIWADNAEAAEGVVNTQYAYALCAFEKGDLDLAASLLETSPSTEHADLLEEVTAAQEERVRSERRSRMFRRIMFYMAVSIMIIVSTASYLIYQQKKLADEQRQEAVEQKKLAEEQKSLADEQRQEAVLARARAEEEKRLADKAREAALVAKQEAETQRQLALKEKQEADLARDAAEAAKQEAEKQRQNAELNLARYEEAEQRAKELEKKSREFERIRTTLAAEYSPGDSRARQITMAERLNRPAEWSIPIVDGIDLEMRLIPPGKYIMGSDEKEKNRGEGERLHYVTITRPYYIGAFEFSETQWHAVVGSLPDEKRKNDPAPGQPVTQVSWSMIKNDLLPRLQEVAPAGTTFRLPTEAEWEYACRALSYSVFNTGNAEMDLEAAGWYLENSERRVNPIGQKLPNAWGVYDMHGNVLEWCIDAYDAKWYLDSPEMDPINQAEAEKQPKRVVRGGGGLNLPEHCRSAYRSWGHFRNNHKFLGFRLVLELPAEETDAVKFGGQ